MVDINKIVWNLKENWKKIYKSFDDRTTYYTMFEYIKNATNISVIGHDNIDGDSLGSTLAIQQWLKNKFSDKKITAYTNSKPWAVFDFLKADIKYWDDLVFDDDIDLFIVLDAANVERLWDLYENNKEKITKTDIINIDHHISNTNFWKINIVDGTAPATAQIVYDIISSLENKVNNLINKTSIWFNENVANYLLMWILTDTQVFMINTANAKTLSVASDLMKKWADKNYLIDNLFQNKSIEQLKLEWIIFDRIKVVKKDDITFCYSYYTIKDLENLWLDVKDSALWKWIVSKLISLKWMNFVCLWRIKKDTTSLSFRSKNYDVNQLAWKFNWWGHKNASWAKLSWNIKPEDIENKILSNL